MELLHQPFNGQLGDRLMRLLGSPSYHTLNIVVAFAKNSGILRLKHSIEEFRSRGGKVNAYIGVDLGVTSYEALINLSICTDSLSVVHAEKSQTFHPKIYQFIGKEKGLVVVGSHNLTGGGLWTNFESSAHIQLNLTDPKDVAISKDQEEYFSHLSALNESFMPISSRDDIEILLKNSYVSYEVKQQLKRALHNRGESNGRKLFGKGYAAKLPSVDTTSKDASSIEVDPKHYTVQIKEYHELTQDYKTTIWFETRRMTGGSRNILDLSMRSLVEKGNPTGTPFDRSESGYMRGGVEFFGIDPASKDIEKDITINFEGVDYINNTILFPPGNRSNGTWRLQIKGISLSNVKITDAFRDKEAGFLVQKIITFSKVKDDYYFLSVFPESELASFEQASRILARNGATRAAKRFGLL